jgi:ribonuclease P protein component
MRLLISRKDLFESGNSFYTSHFKVVWDQQPGTLPCPAQIVFSVSKKGFKHAVTRNLIKRRMREAYRKNKWTLYNYLASENIQIALVIILLGKSVPDYPVIENSMKEVINKMINQMKSEDGRRKTEI